MDSAVAVHLKDSAGRTTVPEQATAPAATSFVPAGWRGYLDTTRGQGRGAAYRHYWERSVLYGVRARLRSGDLWVPGSIPAARTWPTTPPPTAPPTAPSTARWSNGPGTVKIITGHTDWVRGVAFSPGAHRLATAASADATVRLWNPDTGQPIGQQSASPPATGCGCGRRTRHRTCCAPN